MRIFRQRFQLLSPVAFARRCGLLLDRCTKAKALKPCKQIHGLTITKHVDMTLLSLSSKVIGAYASAGDLASAEVLFQITPDPNAFAFNRMIMGLSCFGFQEEAIGYFELFRRSWSANCSPNRYTLSAVLKCCGGLLELVLGEQVHGLVYTTGFAGDSLVDNGLIDMYGKCRKLDAAREVFDKMTERTVVSWTSLICGYAYMGRVDEAMALFNAMSSEGLEPNEFTWSAVLAMHSRIGDCDSAFELFSQMINGGMVPDLATWNSIITGLVQGGRPAEALVVFSNMITSGFKPDQVTITGLLPGCVLLASSARGRELHCLVYRMGIDINVLVSTALIDMYSKCGFVNPALNVFASARNRDVASWNAMIGCYGKHGMVDSAIELFEKMQDEGLQPSEVTVTSILCGCSHGGLVEEGLKIFGLMGSYGMEPSKEHLSCIVDLLCRHGRMEESFSFICKMRNSIPESTFGAFLNGCKIHGRRDLADKLHKVMEMELQKPADLVTLSNIYACEGKWGGVADVRGFIKDMNRHKNPGFSSV